MSNATLAQIYDLLDTGTSIAMQFPCKEDAVDFRRTFQIFKLRREKLLIETGMITRQVLNMQWDATKSLAIFKFTPQEQFEQKLYEIIPLESECVNMKVSG